MSTEEAPLQTQHRLSLIPELLEQIFLNVPAIQLIARFRRVCKTWKILIEESSQLQHYMKTGLTSLPLPTKDTKRADGGEPNGDGEDSDEDREDEEPHVTPLALDVLSAFWRAAVQLAITEKPDLLNLRTSLLQLLTKFQPILQSTSLLYPPGSGNLGMYENWKSLRYHYSREDGESYHQLFTSSYWPEFLERIARQLVELLYFNTPVRVTRGHVASRIMDRPKYERVTREYSEGSTKAFVFFVLEIFLRRSFCFPKLMFDCYEPFAVRVPEDGEVACVYQDEGDNRMWWLSEYQSACYFSSDSDY